VQRLAQLHGGSAAAASGPGRGSELTVRFPKIPPWRGGRRAGGHAAPERRRARRARDRGQRGRARRAVPAARARRPPRARGARRPSALAISCRRSPRSR
jgi:hypothetical protein